MKTAIQSSMGALLLLGAALPVLCRAELLVTATEPRIVGDSAVVTVEMRNGFEERIEAARAVVFLFDERGKLLEHRARWVVGGPNARPGLGSEAGLAAGATNKFVFVLPGVWEAAQDQSLRREVAHADYAAPSWLEGWQYNPAVAFEKDLKRMAGWSTALLPLPYSIGARAGSALAAGAGFTERSAIAATETGMLKTDRRDNSGGKR